MHEFEAQISTYMRKPCKALLRPTNASAGIALATFGSTLSPSPIVLPKEKNVVGRLCSQSCFSHASIVHLTKQFERLTFCSFHATLTPVSVVRHVNTHRLQFLRE